MFEHNISTSSPKYINPTRQHRLTDYAVASSIVFIRHYLMHFMAMNLGYGYDERHYRWIALPIIKITYAGISMVLVFYLVSGYVMALKAYETDAQEQSRISRSATYQSFKVHIRDIFPPLPSGLGRQLSYRHRGTCWPARDVSTKDAEREDIILRDNSSHVLFIVGAAPLLVEKWASIHEYF
ncbi:hypothetical protein B0O99DRAFT_86413 [Bisporella sp. PMI_857]|nr:hypothetical protein B0O99DRAFT_86413 [Bisporella sp. PMI_857]